MEEEKIRRQLAEIICRDVLCGEIIKENGYLAWRGAKVGQVHQILEGYSIQEIIRKSSHL
jgi:hypothetical protein